MNHVEQELFDMLKDARESCAGSRVLDADRVRWRLIRTQTFIIENKSEITNADKIQEYVKKAIIDIGQISTYYERLPIDEILCKLLNDMKRMDVVGK